MFSGFTDETFQFFAAIRFNNNVSFFHANHDWYECAVREPLKDLAAELGETVLSICENLETRPEKVVSRINRDVRFSKDKSPYRDHMWLSFRRPGAPQGSELCIYVAIDVNGCEAGFGIHDQVRPLMNAIRREIRVNPEGFEEDAQAAFSALTLGGEAYRRMKVPENLPPLCAQFYPLKGFWMFKGFTDRAGRAGCQLLAPATGQCPVPTASAGHTNPSAINQSLRILRGSKAHGRCPTRVRTEFPLGYTVRKTYGERPAVASKGSGRK